MNFAASAAAAVRKLQVTVVSATLAMHAMPVLADVFHYANFIPGDRAIGMGGAYTSLSADASGVIYNPAGLAMANNNEISGSANAFFDQKTTYKKALGSEDFSDENSGSMSPFFGGIYRLDDTVKGLVAGFGVYATDQAVRNQNQFIKDQQFNGSTISRFHREAHDTTEVNYFAGAAAKSLTKNLAVGFGVAMLTVDELSQTYQDVRQNITVASLTATSATTRAIRTELAAKGIEPEIGVLFLPTKSLALGLTLKKAMLISQEYDYDMEQSNATLDSKDKIIAGDPAAPDILYKRESTKFSKPLGSWPGEVRLGISYGKAKHFTAAFDTSYHFAAKDGDDAFKRNAVANVALGLEYFPISALALRGGVFTNRDARDTPKEGGANQADHIDFVGASAALAYVDEEKQFSLGMVYQSGSGKAQKLGTGPIQDVSSKSTTIIISTSYTLDDDDECVDKCKADKKKKKS